MSEKEIIGLTEDQLYDMGDRSSLAYAKLIRERIETRAEQRGFARRLLNCKHEGTAADDVEMTFEMKEPSDARIDEMKVQITLAESNHYIREDRKLFDWVRNNLPSSQIIEASWNDFSPRLVAQARQLISDQMMPVTRTVFASTFWSAIIGNNEFAQIFDPNTRYENIMNGRLGTCFGLKFDSDAFAHPLLKITNAGEMFFFAPPKNLGKMEILGRDTGLLIENGDDEVQWKIPHDFRQFDLNIKAVSMLRLK